MPHDSIEPEQLLFVIRVYTLEGMKVSKISYAVWDPHKDTPEVMHPVEEPETLF